jgi:hypothetical protein
MNCKKCAAECIIKVSRSQANLNKEFYSCPAGCQGWVGWVDPTMNVPRPQVEQKPATLLPNASKNAYYVNADGDIACKACGTACIIKRSKSEKNMNKEYYACQSNCNIWNGWVEAPSSLKPPSPQTSLKPPHSLSPPLKPPHSLSPSQQTPPKKQPATQVVVPKQVTQVVAPKKTTQVVVDQIQKKQPTQVIAPKQVTQVVVDQTQKKQVTQVVVDQIQKKQPTQGIAPKQPTQVIAPKQPTKQAIAPKQALKQPVTQNSKIMILPEENLSDDEIDIDDEC